MKKLKALIKDSGLKDYEIANRLGIKGSKLSKVLSKQQKVDPMLALKVCREFKFKISVLEFWYTPAEIRAIKKGLL